MDSMRSDRAKMRASSGAGPILFDDYHGLDDDRIDGYILVALAAGRGHAANFVQHLFAFDHLAEHRVAPALHVLAAVVEEVVVLHIDEELGGGGVRIRGSGHGDSAEVVLQAIVGFVLNGLAAGLLLHVGVKPPPWIMKLSITRWKMVPS